MIYEFRCKKHGIFEVWQNMDAEHSARCPQCDTVGERIYGNTRFTVDWVNGGWKGEGLNFGLGKHFKSIAERDYYAASHGWVAAGDDW